MSSVNIVLNLRIHQPCRLKHVHVMDIGLDKPYFNESLNSRIIEQISKNCYIPTAEIFQKFIDRYKDQFKLSFTISGIVIEQLQMFAPNVLDTFKKLSDSGSVEFVTEPFFRSLASLYDTDEFIDQVILHRNIIKKEFNHKSEVFSNTEFIYRDKISDIIFSIVKFNTILTRNFGKFLKWRSPLFTYKNYSKNLSLLFKNEELLDELVFKFDDKSWKGFPLTAPVFLKKIHKLAQNEDKNKVKFFNMFLDYEVFGEHHKKETGIFEFFDTFLELVIKDKNCNLVWPSECFKLSNYQQESISFTESSKVRKNEIEAYTWIKNDFQRNAIETLFEVLNKIKEKGRSDLLKIIRRLSAADHFYYMTVSDLKSDVNYNYFSPYNSPEQAYVYYMNTLADLEERIYK